MGLLCPHYLAGPFHSDSLSSNAQLHRSCLNEKTESTRLLPDRLFRVRQRLQLGYIRCHRHLKEAFDELRREDGTLDFEWQDSGSLFDEDYRESRTTIGRVLLREAASAIVQCAEDLFDIQSPDEKFALYFWPGYNSVLRKPSEKRVTLTREVGKRQVSCGAGIDRSTSEAEFHTGVYFDKWFDSVLDLPEGDLTAAFIPGGTHRWCTELNSRIQDAVLVSSMPNLRELPSLVFLEVSADDELRSEGENEPDPTRLKVSLDRGEPDQWPDSICGRLHEARRVVVQRLNSIPLDSTRLQQLDWPCPLVPSANAEDANSADAQELRRLLYRPWLGSVFGVDSGLDEFLDRTIEEILGFCTTHSFVDPSQFSHIRGIKKERGLERKVSYRYWYTLPLDLVLNLDGELDSLGSVMLMATHRISDPFLFLISSWAYRVYSEFRRLEHLLMGPDAGTASILHEVPAAFSGAISDLKRYAAKYHFPIPTALYSAAMRALEESGKISPEDFERYAIRLPDVDKHLAQNGVDDGLIDLLTCRTSGREGIAYLLARERFKHSSFKPPDIATIGSSFAFRDACREPLHALALIDLLIVLLREAIFHAALFASETHTQGHVTVSITEDDVAAIVLIENDARKDARPKTAGNQVRAIDTMKAYLPHCISVSQATNRDGLWRREITLELS